MSELNSHTCVVKSRNISQGKQSDMNIFKNIFKYVENYYVSKIEYNYKKRMKNPIRMMIIDLATSLIILTLIFIIIAITTPVFRSMVKYTIEEYTTYESQIDKLSKETNMLKTAIENAKNDMLKAAMEAMKRFKNPTFNGIKICGINGIKSVYPSSRSLLEKKVYYHLAVWSNKEGYDAVIFGNLYSGLNGTLYWSDGKNPEYDTDLELIINMLKQKGCKRIMSFISNPENKNYIPYVANYITGTLNISEVQNYNFEVLNYKFWKSNMRSILIQADNFNAELVNEKLMVILKPGKTEN